MVRKLACGALSVSIVCALPSRWKNSVVKRGAVDIETEYDYIVVGGGAAGITVADRLSEDETSTVLVIEYGSLSLDDSFMPPFNSPAPQFLYNLTTTPQTAVMNRTFPVANGCVVGGGSAVNGQLHNRGSKQDYDNWARFPGNEAWGWDGIYPYFKKSASLRVPTKEMQDAGITYDLDAWGQTTPIYASYPSYLYPGQRIQWQAWAEEEGVEVQREHANGHAYGLMWIPTAMDSEAAYNRSFAAQGHWINVPPRDNYHLLTEHKVLNVNFEKEGPLYRATSVHVRPRFDNKTVFAVKARKEIVLSAAAIRTPQILQLSGIGPKKILEEAGIETLVDLPGVGWNLQDHAFSSSLFNFTNDVWPPSNSMTTNATFKAEALAQYKKNNTGPFTSYVVSSGVYLPASVVLGDQTSTFVERIQSQPAQQYLPANIAPELLAGYSVQKRILQDSFQSNSSAIFEHLFSGAARGTVIQLKPFSRGIVKINPLDLAGEPIVDSRVFSNPLDLSIHIRMQQYIRHHYMTSPILAQLKPVELDPGPTLPSDADVENWLIRQGKISASNGHSSGTAAMMPRTLGGVVDGKLRVYGTLGLSVADGSIIPLIPGAHTMTTAYAIGEKAADLIKERNK